MIIQREFLSRLKDFGINSYEAKLWTALLSRGVATAGELSDIANVPRSRSYDVLESLERKGFVILKLGKPIKYIAVPPSEVIERVKKNIQEESEIQTKTLESLKNSKILQDLSNLHKSGSKTVDPVDITGAVRGKNNVKSHYSSLFRNAQKTIHLITTEQSLMNEYDSLYNSLQKARQKGVNIQLIVSQTKKADELVKQFESIASMRFNDNSVGRFCVVDGKTLSFFVDENNLSEFCVWVNAPFVAKSFENIFLKLWSALKQ